MITNGPETGGGRPTRMRLDETKTLSELMTLAVNDLESVTAEAGVQADMVFWGDGRISEVLRVGDDTDREDEDAVENNRETDIEDGGERAHCTVCLAGAVMVREGWYPHEPHTLEITAGLSPAEAGRLYAVDQLRRGNVLAAMRAMHLPEGVPTTKERLEVVKLLQQPENLFKEPGPLTREETIISAEWWRATGIPALKAAGL